ncbi:MAG: branched-chain amino acid ABC transporter permease, partial [Actinomycetota bacterium]|nr:branched-chain amino acid ABC transporter permease [Actinomycetota bacterium]
PTDIGFLLVVLALTMMIIGGTASWVGALIGAVIFTWLPSLLEQIGEWQHLVYGTLVALAAIFMPGGLLGVMKDGWRRWQRRRRPAIRAEESVPAAAEAQAEAEDSEARAEAALASLGTIDERSPR